jgi:hypothetical protein
VEAEGEGAAELAVSVVPSPALAVPASLHASLDDVLPNACREKLVADDAVDHGADFALSQPIDGNGGRVRPSDPRRLELWPECHDQQHSESWYLVHDSTEQFEARGVGPMGILENHQHRIFAR